MMLLLFKQLNADKAKKSKSGKKQKTVSAFTKRFFFCCFFLADVTVTHVKDSSKPTQTTSSFSDHVTFCP